MNLNLGINIPLSYIELIYDCMIQITQALDFAHKNGLAHGSFGLNNVVVHNEGDTPIYKITNFTPGTGIKQPVSTEANFWPFVRGRKK
jgi:serine/threonine protein kinase